MILKGKLRVESGWLIADPEEFTSDWNLVLGVRQEFWRKPLVPDYQPSTINSQLGL
jgi:hypothetical protein